MTGFYQEVIDTSTAPREESTQGKGPKLPSSHSRYPSAQTFTPGTSAGSRVTSFQSRASAPAVLSTAPTSTHTSPSHPPSQYSPLENHIRCSFLGCAKLYTPSLLGPTFYSAQQPHQLVRKEGLCVCHANHDLKIAEVRVKKMWETMRQDAGRKTLGLIAAEFEVWKTELSEERSVMSEEWETRQRTRVLGGVKSKKKGKSKGKNEKEEDSWDWRYTPRPCTLEACPSGKRYYSPYDNRLCLFYHMPRPSGLLPLITLCPNCAKGHVQDAEHRMEGWKQDGGGAESVEWKQWRELLKKDRVMEGEYWEAAQEITVKDKGVDHVGSDGRKEERRGHAGTVVLEGEGGGKKGRKSDKLKDICVMM